MKSRSGINPGRYFPGILISLLAFFILSKYISLENLYRSFGMFSIFDILIFVLILLLALVARGFVWQSLIGRISLRDSFLIINEGYLFNNLIPRSGEVVRVFLTSKITKIDAFQIATAIFFERAIDLIIAAGMFLTTLSLILEATWLKSTALWIIVVFSVLIILVLSAAFFSFQIEQFIKSRSSKNHLWETKIKPLILRALNGLVMISQPKTLITALFWIICTWIFWVLMLFYAILKIHPEAPLWWALFTEGIIALGIALPSAPASLGVYEGSFVFALSQFGIDNETALSTAIILHLIQIAVTTILGLVGLFLFDLKIGDVVQSIQTRLLKKKDTS